MNQTSIFDEIYPQYKITKPIRLIELFAGYGSQALALKYLGVPFEHWKICEWAVKSIQAYKDIHFPNEYHPYGYLEEKKEDLVDYLFELGISSNYNEPMTKEQINRLKQEDLANILENIYITNNLVNIQKTKGEDLEIVDTDKYEYIMTYSFPCQDLSVAGKKQGMSDKSTRSGMLWEVERILKECKELGTLPQILLMENVTQVHGKKNIDDFQKWQDSLSEMGYKNYYKDLIATDYGIPQTRKRTFMISILGEYSYTFPKPIPLELKLKDLLEDNVDEKYYLSDKMLDYCYGVNQKESKFPRGKRFEQSLKQTNENNIANTVTTNAGNRPTDNFLKENMKTKLCNSLIEQGKVKENDVIRHSYTTSREKEWEKRSIEKNNISPTLDTRSDCLGVVVNDDYVGTYDYAQSDTLRPTQDSRTHINSDTSGSLLASGNHNGVITNVPLKRGYSCSVKEEQNNVDGVDVIGNYSKSNYSQTSIVNKNGNAPTFTENHGQVTAISVYTDVEKQLFTEDGNIKRYINSDIVDKFEEGQMATTTFPNGYGHGPRTHNQSIALNTVDKPSVKHNLRIRKLTPKECFRLQGVKDEDFEKCAKNQSNASLYHLAGDSIVVDVLCHIFNQFFKDS